MGYLSRYETTVLFGEGWRESHRVFHAQDTLCFLLHLKYTPQYQSCYTVLKFELLHWPRPAVNVSIGLVSLLLSVSPVLHILKVTHQGQHRCDQRTSRPCCVMEHILLNNKQMPAKRCAYDCGATPINDLLNILCYNHQSGVCASAYIRL